MERVAFVLRIKPGALEEYRQRHAAIWPDMVAALEAAGARNYSIFLDQDELRLFAYLEADPDFAALVKRINADPVNMRWQRYMRDIMESEIDPRTEWAPRLDELFHMD